MKPSRAIAPKTEGAEIAAKTPVPLAIRIGRTLI